MKIISTFRELAQFINNAAQSVEGSTTIFAVSRSDHFRLMETTLPPNANVGSPSTSKNSQELVTPVTERECEAWFIRSEMFFEKNKNYAVVKITPNKRVFLFVTKNVNGETLKPFKFGDAPFANSELQSAYPGIFNPSQAMLDAVGGVEQ